MPLARHDDIYVNFAARIEVSTHMPLARHDIFCPFLLQVIIVSTHMPLARHDDGTEKTEYSAESFYSHASCEA